MRKKIKKILYSNPLSLDANQWHRLSLDANPPHGYFNKLFIFFSQLTYNLLQHLSQITAYSESAIFPLSTDIISCHLRDKKKHAFFCFSLLYVYTIH